jgi:hypothetical protein
MYFIVLDNEKEDNGLFDEIRIFIKKILLCLINMDYFVKQGHFIKQIIKIAENNNKPFKKMN